MSLTPMLVVADVPASSAWYTAVLGLSSGHGGEQFEMMMGADGQPELFLHHREFGEHPGMTDPREGTVSRGVLLYFSVPDAQAIFDRAKAVDADLIDEPHFNPNARSIEFTLRDLDGYPIAVSQRRGNDGTE